MSPHLPVGRLDGIDRFVVSGSLFHHRYSSIHLLNGKLNVAFHSLKRAITRPFRSNFSFEAPCRQLTTGSANVECAFSITHFPSFLVNPTRLFHQTPLVDRLPSLYTSFHSNLVLSCRNIPIVLLFSASSSDPVILYWHTLPFLFFTITFDSSGFSFLYDNLYYYVTFNMRPHTAPSVAPFARDRFVYPMVAILIPSTLLFPGHYFITAHPRFIYLTPN